MPRQIIDLKTSELIGKSRRLSKKAGEINIASTKEEVLARVSECMDAIVVGFDHYKALREEEDKARKDFFRVKQGLSSSTMRRRAKKAYKRCKSSYYQSVIALSQHLYELAAVMDVIFNDEHVCQFPSLVYAINTKRVEVFALHKKVGEGYLVGDDLQEYLDNMIYHHNDVAYSGGLKHKDYLHVRKLELAETHYILKDQLERSRPELFERGASRQISRFFTQSSRRRSSLEKSAIFSTAKAELLSKSLPASFDTEERQEERLEAHQPIRRSMSV